MLGHDRPSLGLLLKVKDVAATYPDGTQKVLFTPLAPYETPDAVDAICESFNRTIDDFSIDPLVLIPIFINDFLCIHPSGASMRFSAANGRGR